MHEEVILGKFLAAVTCIVVIGAIMRRLRQPSIIGYLFAGAVMKYVPFLPQLSQNEVAWMGDIGVILLLFFIGLEIPIDTLKEHWKKSLIASFVQIVVFMVLLMILQFWLQWSFPKVVMFSYILTLSSTAVVIKMLQDANQMSTTAGQIIIAILVAQDVLLAPMLISLNFVVGKSLPMTMIFLQILGVLFIISVLTLIFKRERFHLYFAAKIRADHEMQVFVALLFCFAMAAITTLTGLSAGLGAFVGGLVVASARETDWIQARLESFKVVFLAFFFVSVGMLVDFGFIRENYQSVIFLACIVFVVNSVLLTIILKTVGYSFTESLYSAALLSQIGEFGFILIQFGLSNGIVSDFGYKQAVSVICLTLFVTPFWVAVIKRISARKVLDA